MHILIRAGKVTLPCIAFRVACRSRAADPLRGRCLTRPSATVSPSIRQTIPEDVSLGFQTQTLLEQLPGQFHVNWHADASKEELDALWSRLLKDRAECSYHYRRGTLRPYENHLDAVVALSVYQERLKLGLARLQYALKNYDKDTGGRNAGLSWLLDRALREQGVTFVQQLDHHIKVLAASSSNTFKAIHIFTGVAVARGILLTCHPLITLYRMKVLALRLKAHNVNDTLLEIKKHPRIGDGRLVCRIESLHHISHSIVEEVLHVYFKHIGGKGLADIAKHFQVEVPLSERVLKSVTRVLRDLLWFYHEQVRLGRPFFQQYSSMLKWNSFFQQQFAKEHEKPLLEAMETSMKYSSDLRPSPETPKSSYSHVPAYVTSAIRHRISMMGPKATFRTAQLPDAVTETSDQGIQALTPASFKNFIYTPTESGSRSESAMRGRSGGNEGDHLATFKSASSPSHSASVDVKHLVIESQRSFPKMATDREREARAQASEAGYSKAAWTELLISYNNYFNQCRAFQIPPSSGHLLWRSIQNDVKENRLLYAQGKLKAFRNPLWAAAAYEIFLLRLDGVLREYRAKYSSVLDAFRDWNDVYTAHVHIVRLRTFFHRIYVGISSIRRTKSAIFQLTRDLKSLAKTSNSIITRDNAYYEHMTRLTALKLNFHKVIDNYRDIHRLLHKSKYRTSWTLRAKLPVATLNSLGKDIRAGKQLVKTISDRRLRWSNPAQHHLKAAYDFYHDHFRRANDTRLVIDELDEEYWRKAATNPAYISRAVWMRHWAVRTEVENMEIGIVFRSIVFFIASHIRKKYNYQVTETDMRDMAAMPAYVKLGLAYQSHLEALPDLPYPLIRPDSHGSLILDKTVASNPIAFYAKQSVPIKVIPTPELETKTTAGRVVAPEYNASTVQWLHDSDEYNELWASTQSEDVSMNKSAISDLIDSATSFDEAYAPDVPTRIISSPSNRVHNHTYGSFLRRKRARQQSITLAKSAAQSSGMLDKESRHAPQVSSTSGAHIYAALLRESQAAPVVSQERSSDNLELGVDSAEDVLPQPEPRPWEASYRRRSRLRPQGYGTLLQRFHTPHMQDQIAESSEIDSGTKTKLVDMRPVEANGTLVDSPGVVNNRMHEILTPPRQPVLSAMLNSGVFLESNAAFRRARFYASILNEYDKAHGIKTVTVVDRIQQARIGNSEDRPAVLEDVAESLKAEWKIKLTADRRSRAVATKSRLRAKKASGYMRQTASSNPKQRRNSQPYSSYATPENDMQPTKRTRRVRGDLQSGYSKGVVEVKHDQLDSIKQEVGSILDRSDKQDQMKQQLEHKKAKQKSTTPRSKRLHEQVRHELEKRANGTKIISVRRLESGEHGGDLVRSFVPSAQSEPILVYDKSAREDQRSSQVAPQVRSVMSTVPSRRDRLRQAITLRAGGREERK